MDETTGTTDTGTTGTTGTTSAPEPAKPTPSTFHTLAEKLGKIGFTHERKALSLSILGLFTGYFLLLTLIARSELPEWFPAFSAMFTLYAFTFFSVAAHWFWGRWVAIGVGSWGATIAVWGVVTARAFEPALVILGVTHGLVALLLSGSSMATHYEGRSDWRVRFGLDDEGVKRLRRSVTRAASSIPAIVLFALAPRQDAGMAVALFAVAGLAALLMGRTIALGALALAAAGALGLAAFGHVTTMDTHGLYSVPTGQFPALLGIYAGIALLASIGPFVGPIGRFLRSK